jgi:hypothetical protein
MNGERPEQNVLTIPLLLHLLKQFAQDRKLTADSQAEEFPELKNRYSIYRHVIAAPGGLIDEGLSSLRRHAGGNNDSVRFHGLDDAFDKLGQIAIHPGRGRRRPQAIEHRDRPLDLRRPSQKQRHEMAAPVVSGILRRLPAGRLVARARHA